MKNIGIVVDNEFDSDIRVTREVNILIKQGFKVSILCFAFDKKRYKKNENCNIKRIRINRKIKNILFFLLNRFPFYDLLWKREIRKFIVDNSIEVLHVHDLYMSRPAHMGVVASGLKVPLILDLHENFPFAIQSYNWTRGVLRNLIINPKAWELKEGKYLACASKIIVLSDSFKFDLLSRYSFLEEGQIQVFPNVVDIELFEAFEIDESVKKSNNTTLMYFGAIAERRGIFETLYVLEKAIDENLQVELLLIGPVDKSDQKRFFDRINCAKLKNNVIYVPWIDISELPTYMNIADVFLSPLIKNPQHESGVANKIFQYMFGGKPIIASDCLPQKEIIETFNCGLIYSTQKEFLSCVAKLVLDEKLSKELGLNGKNELHKNFDADTYEIKLLGIYNEFL